jgi:ectoine hydroxylase-related dioxygenase (phytanoyl-CoA dioxygenase family)
MPAWFCRDIAVAAAELEQERLSEAQFRQALLLLHTRGFVILRGAIPRPIIDVARAAFDSVFQDCLASREGDAWYQVSREHQAVFWQRGARWRIFPKLRAPLDSPWIVANPLAMSLVTRLLGDDCFCKFVSSDSCVRGSELQSPHRELGCGGQSQPLAYIVNVPLVPCGLHNGPLEIWPGGTHLWHNDLLDEWQFGADVQDGRNPEIEDYARDWPSVKVELEPGDVLVRDPGLLHRGTPNPTDEPRSMLTISFFRRGHAWDYGQPEYNVTPEIYANLDPQVRRYFAYAFSKPADAPAAAASEPRDMWARLSSAFGRKAA